MGISIVLFTCPPLIVFGVNWCPWTNHPYKKQHNDSKQGSCADSSIWSPCLGFSKLGKGNPGSMWNLIPGLIALRENSVQIFLLAIWSLDVLKRIVKNFHKRLLNKELKKPGLGLISLWTTGPCPLSILMHLWHEIIWEVRNIRNREEKGKILSPFISALYDSLPLGNKLVFS